jgi:hypothetical protein
MSKARRNRSRTTPPRRRRAIATPPAGSQRPHHAPPLVEVRLSTATPTAPKKKRERKHYNERLHAVTPALYPRAFSARRLNISIATILRLEQQGVLTPIRLNPNSPVAAVYHRSEQVERLAGGGGA